MGKEGERDVTPQVTVVPRLVRFRISLSSLGRPWSGGAPRSRPCAGVLAEMSTQPYVFPTIISRAEPWQQEPDVSALAAGVPTRGVSDTTSSQVDWARGSAARNRWQRMPDVSTHIGIPLPVALHSGPKWRQTPDVRTHLGSLLPTLRSFMVYQLGERGVGRSPRRRARDAALTSGTCFQGCDIDDNSDEAPPRRGVSGLRMANRCGRGARAGEPVRPRGQGRLPAPARPRPRCPHASPPPAPMRWLASHADADSRLTSHAPSACSLYDLESSAHLSPP